MARKFLTPTQLSKIIFNQSSDAGLQQGELIWDSEHLGIMFGLSASTQLEIGQQNVILSYNETGSTIPAGRAVYGTGATNNRPSISPSTSATAEQSSRTFGVTAEPVPSGGYGWVTTSGILTGIDTSLYVAGDELWLSSSSPGILVTSPIGPPNHDLLVGYCVTSSSVDGAIYLTFSRGVDVSGIHDIVLNSQANNDLIIYNSASNFWVNKQINKVPFDDIPYIDFSTASTVPVADVAKMVWDDGEGTLTFGLKGGNVDLSIGTEQVALCYNGTGSALTDGQVVYISGAQGQRPTISLAQANTESLSSKALGIVTEPIANGAEGFVTTFGIVNGINTSSYTAGDALWLSPTVAGGFTKTKPSSPNHLVFIGYVISVNASSGRIFVKPQNGYELDELHDVLITSKADNDIITYNGSSSVWVNQNLNAAILEIDGTGSNIDADLLDGQHGSYYLDWTNTTNKPDLAITLGGDLSGSATFTDLANGTLTATINANSVALGTDTTGNYVSQITGTTDQVTVTGSGSESASVTLSLPQNIATSSSPTFAGLTTTSRITTPASVTGTAPFRIPHGTAPSSPVNGDIWTTTAGIYVRVNGVTVGPLGTGGGGTVTVSDTAPVGASIGDLWYESDTGKLYVYYDSYWVETVGSGGATGDLSGYLTISSASSTYLTQTSASTIYAPLASPTFTGTITTPLTTAGYVTTTSGGVLGSVATIPNAGLTNSSVTIGSTSVSLGGTVTTVAGLTLTSPTIDTIAASAAAATPVLWSTVTTGSIGIGQGLTTGALNIATVGTGVTPISIGHTNATIGITGNTTITGTLTVTGNLDTNLTTAGVVTTNASGVLSSTAAVGVANGGTGLTATPTNGQLPIGNGSGYALATLTQGTGITITNGAGTISIANAGVTTLSFGTTGLTPSTATSGAITVAGTLAAANGGTGQSSYAVGDLLYASTTSALSKLADVATGNALISGGVGVAPSWGKIGLATHVSGTLGVGSGGTGLTSYAVGDIIYASATGTLASLADVATGNVIISGGVGVAPSYGKVGLTTHVSGTLGITNGGTGVSTAPSANGQILIGASGGTYALGTIGQGTGITVTNGTNTISIANAGVLSFSAGTTGFTPSTATTGAVTLAGTLATTNGGTGLTSFTANGAVYATSTSALTTGTLPVASGGTGVTTSTGSTNVVLSNTPTLTTPVIDVISAASAATTSTLWSTITTGSIGIGQGLTTGALNLATVGTGATPISIGHTNATIGITGTSTFTGNVGIGTTNPIVNFHVNADSALTQIRVQRNSTDSSAPSIALVKQRGTSASPTIVSAGDVLGEMLFYGYDGSTRQISSSIQGVVDSTPGSNDMPGRLVFYTTPDGTATLQERMRIDNAGRIGIGGQDPSNWYSRSMAFVVVNNQNAATQIGIGNSTSGTAAATQFSMIGGTGFSYIDWSLADNNGSPYSVMNYGSAVNFATINFGASERLRITNSGNVGIGTPNPSTTLDVNGTGNFTGILTAPTATAGTNTTQVATTAFVQTAVNSVTINTQTIAYTLALTDAGKVVEINMATANNLTVPPNSSVAFPIGTSIDIVQYGIGQITVTAGVGVTIRSAGGLYKLSQQYASASLYKRGTDEWVLIGDLA